MPRAEQHEGSDFLKHIPCNACGSSDANSLYTDNHQYCFSCGHHTPGEGSTGGALVTRAPLFKPVEGEELGLPKRAISQETTEKFRYLTGDYAGKRVQIAPYYDQHGRFVAQKLRFRDKSFSVVGDIAAALPFGAQLWPKTGKMLVVTEGEIDAMSVSQVQGNKWATVSIGCGAGPQIRKYIARHRDYFLGFEKVILMFDTDETGRQAANIAAQVIGPRAHLAELPDPFKDANEMLVAGRTQELINAMWRAKQYRPEGIVELSTLKEECLTRPKEGLSWPFPALTKLTYGIRTGEVIGLGAGTGIGKTDFIAETVTHLVTQHRVPVGYFALEQQPVETATRIAGKIAHKPFHIPDGSWTNEEFNSAWSALEQGGKVFLYDSFGVNEWDTVRDKMEYLRHAEGVQHFFVDHLTAFAAMEDDERKALERIMADIGGMAKRLNAAIMFVSHLATPEGKSHEEGGRVTIRHFKGSRSIGFWSHYMIGLERDQQSDDIAKRSTTVVRILKDRYTGRATGQVFYLGYDHATGLLYETVAPEEQHAGAHGFKDESSDF